MCVRKDDRASPSRRGRVPTATSYEACLYRCSCGRGYSNATRVESRTCIVCSPELNVPAAIRDGLEDVLDASPNTRNLEAKNAKFCFSTSEDAVTWTVFRWLELAPWGSTGRANSSRRRAAPT